MPTVLKKKKKKEEVEVDLFFLEQWVCLHYLLSPPRKKKPKKFVLSSCSSADLSCCSLQLFKKAKAKGYGEHDTAAVYRAAAL